MSEQRTVDAIVGKAKSSSKIYSTKEEAKVVPSDEVSSDEVSDEDKKKLERAERKARLARVLDRGITNDRLAVDLPPHIHGEWVPRDSNEISRMKLLGFEVDTEYAAKRALNSDGSAIAQSGDVIFMTCSKEQKEIIDEIKYERFLQTHGDPKSRKRKGQGGDVPSLVQPNKNIDISGMTVIDESEERSIEGNELAAQVRATLQEPPK